MGSERPSKASNLASRLRMNFEGKVLPVYLLWCFWKSGHLRDCKHLAGLLFSEPDQKINKISHSRLSRSF